MLSAAALFILRLGLGVIFTTHGYLKLWSPRLGPRAFAQYIQRLGVPAPQVVAYAIGLLEFWGGVLLLLGWWTHGLQGPWRFT